MFAITLCIPVSVRALEWTTVMEFIPVPDLFVGLDTWQSTNPMINQFWEEYRDSIYVNYEYIYSGYTFEHNLEYNCHSGAQYCFYINSPYYTYKHTDEFDYRFPFAGFTPFYADYDANVRKIVFDGSKARPEIWERMSGDYTAVGKIKF